MKISTISHHEGVGGLYADIGASEDGDFGAFGGGELGEFSDGEAKDWSG
jgi:hypothetical protein